MCLKNDGVLQIPRSLRASVQVCPLSVERNWISPGPGPDHSIDELLEAALQSPGLDVPTDSSEESS